MNKIEFPRKDVDGKSWTQQEIENWFLNKTQDEIFQNLQTVSPTKNNNIENKLLEIVKNHLSTILVALPWRLELWRDIINRYRPSLTKKFIGNIKKAFDYNSFRANTLVELAKILNIKSCPYCNMHYTLYAEETSKNSKKKELAKFQFDHFFDKSKYPMLSMSLYNLIPSCAVCNHSKLTNKLSLSFHPYHSSICEQFRFKLQDPTDLFCGEKLKKDLINIDLVSNTNNNTDLEVFAKTFHMKALYQRHRDIAQETFDKAYQYPYYSNPSNFIWLSKKSPNYIKRLWMGTYPDEKDIEKRPMTKFIQDLWEQAIRNKMSGKTVI